MLYQKHYKIIDINQNLEFKKNFLCNKVNAPLSIRKKVTIVMFGARE